MSAVLAIAQPRRIEASHRRRRKVTAGHFVQRYYDPQIGRFLSVDPMVVEAKTAWNFNRYSYASNNPYKFTDPDGRQSIAACGMPQNAAACAEAGIIANGSGAASGTAASGSTAAGSGSAAGTGTASGGSSGAGNGIVASVLAYFGIQMSSSHSDGSSESGQGSSSSTAGAAGAPPPNGQNDGDKQKKGTPRTNTAQNKQFADATRGLTKEQQAIVHREASGQNLSYQELKALAEAVKNGSY